VLLVFPAALFVIIQSNIVQTYMAQRVSAYLSEELKTKVSIGKVDIRFFMDVTLKDVYIDDLHQNPLITAEKINVKLGDYNIKGNYFELRKVILDNTAFHLHKYKHEEKTNLQFLVDYFKSDEEKKKYDYPLKLKIDKLQIYNSAFSYVDDNKMHKPGMVDFSNIGIAGLNLDMRNVAIIQDSVASEIKNLSFYEKSGFAVKRFSSLAKVSRRNIVVNNLLARTLKSDLDLDLAFLYDDFGSFKDFVHKVTIVSDIRPSRLNLLDIAAFVQAMKGMNNEINISSELKGKVSNLKARNFLMHYGSDTYLNADIALNGLPAIKETFFKIKIRQFSSSLADINKVALPASDNGSSNTLHLPDILKRLGNITLKGNLTGFYTNFAANTTLTTDIGLVTADILVNNIQNKIFYNGKIKTENLNAGLLLNTRETFGNVSLDAEINGSGFTRNTVSFTLNGKMNLLEFKNYAYTGITLNGNFEENVFKGQIDVNDKNLMMAFNGKIDLNDSLPVYNFTADVSHAELTKLKLLTRDSISEVKGKMKIDFSGNSIDDINGSVSLQDACFKRNKKIVSLNSMLLVTKITSGGYRTFDLTSDYADAVFRGYFNFLELPYSFTSFLVKYLPDFYFAADTVEREIARQDFDFDIRLYNATPVAEFFIPDIKLAENTSCKGSFNSIKNTADMEAQSSSISFRNFGLMNWKLRVLADDGIINLDLASDTLKISDSLFLSAFDVGAQVNHDSIFSSIKWDNKKPVNNSSADINLFLSFNNKKTFIGVHPSYLILDDNLWTLSTDASVVMDSSRIVFNRLKLFRNEQNIEIYGAISKNPEDVVSIKFNNFNISNFDYLTNAKKFDLDGIITGNLYISDIYNVPVFFADIKVKDFGLNNDKLGDVLLQSKWDDISKGIYLNAEIYYVGAVGKSKPLIANGFYYPSGKNENFDFSINVDNLRLKALSRYISSFASIQSGTATGLLTLKGMASDPELSGSLKVMRALLHINYLNTSYAFAYDGVKVEKNGFSFKDLVFIDQHKGDTGIITGHINHKKFKNISYDISINTKKLMCLNTNPLLNEVFYGKAFATGSAHIYGNQNGINFVISAKTEKGTQLFIPTGYASTLQSSDYISFVSKEDSKGNNGFKGMQLNKGINLDMSFDVTDDAEIQLLFDPRAGDRIRGIGNGNIKIAIASDGDMKMYGDYILSSGDYLFTFQNIINKRFVIDAGSTVKWNGDPYNAELDIVARYKLKSNLAGLGVDTNSHYVPVECVIFIKNVLASPEFSFEVELPNMTDYEKAPYLAAINQNLNNNFISLLVINSFVSPNVGIAQTAASGATLLGKSASEVLSNQLSNWLSQISKNVNIGVNYRPGDDISQEEVEVALSTQLFNDRVSISSNLGVATGQNNGLNRSSNQIVGDVDVEVKITNALKLRVFNHTNQYDILQYNSPYTQGLGLVYRKEFNTVKDLFKRKKKKMLL
jgi:hypothetical protein